MKIRSRLKSQKSKKALIDSVIRIGGLITIVFLLIQFGIPFLGSLSLFFSPKNEASFSENKLTYIPPPLLEQPFEATNSAQISIKGTANTNLSISLYVNDELVDKTSVKSNRTFSFENILLHEGENIIKTKATDKNKKESDFSHTVRVSYLHKEPELSIDQPQENERFPKDFNRIAIKGKTNPNVRVTINSKWAIIDGEGNFSYDHILQEGENVLKIVAIDQAGNKKEIERKVIYAP